MTDIHKLNAEFSKPYKTILTFFRFTCINIFDEKHIVIFKCIPFVVVCLWILNTIYQFTDVFNKIRNGANFLDVALDLSYAYNLTEGCVMYLHLCLIKKRIKNFITKLAEQWPSDDTLTAKNKLFKQQQVKNMNSYTFGICILITIFVHYYFLRSLCIVLYKKILRYEKVSYIKTWEFSVLDYQDSFVKYIIAYIMDYLNVVIAASTINCSLYFQAVSMNQLRILFVILQNDLREIIQSHSEHVDISLKRTIRRHSNLSELLRELGNAYGGIFSIRIFFLSGTVCFYGISAKVNLKMEDVKNLAVSLLIVLNIFYCAIWGQLSTDAALSVATVIYDSPWEQLSVKNKKIIIMTILRSQRAAYIRSTSFVEISLNTFATTLKICWSFISLVTTLIGK